MVSFCQQLGVRGRFSAVVKQKNPVTEFKLTKSARTGVVVFVWLINVSLVNAVVQQQGYPTEQDAGWKNAASRAWGSEQSTASLNRAAYREYRWYF